MANSSKMKTGRRNTITHKACLAWSLVRIALQWRRKGGIFKKWPLLELLSLFSKHLKTLTHHHSKHDRYYGELQLSFDETPLFNVKKKMNRDTTSSMRFLFPCIASSVEFEYEFEMDGHDCSDEVQLYGYDEICKEECDRMVKDDEEEEKGVDLRAEEFIAKFYKQIKVERQISNYLEYYKHNDVVSL